MGMRKEYRPFDAELAKKGAPYGFANDDYEVKIYEYFDSYCVGAAKKGVGIWVANGWPYSEFSELKMLPIAHCQSQPVYVGDTLYDANGERFEVEVGHTASMLEGCSWNSPVKKVGTRITSHEFVEITKHCKSANQEWFAIANAAIARAIEDGDVVSKETLKEIVKFVHNLDVAGPDVAWVHVEAAYFGD